MIAQCCKAHENCFLEMWKVVDINNFLFTKSWKGVKFLYEPSLHVLWDIQKVSG